MSNNPTSNIEKALKRGKTLRLSSFDKSQIRKVLLNSMEVPSARQVSRLRVSSWSYFYTRVPVAAALVLLLGVGTSAAAERAVPGDTLYPVKVGVNEKVETLLTFSDKGMAEVTAKHALTRLAEAETLASEGKLDAQTKAEVEVNFYSNVANLRSNLKKLEGRGDFSAAANVSGSFEEGLGEHLGAFVNLSTNVATATGEIASMADSVGSELQSTQNERIALRDRQVSAAATTTVSQAQNSIDEAQHKILEVESFVGAQASTSVSVSDALTLKLNAAHDALTQATAAFNEGDYPLTFALSKKAQTLAQDAKLVAILSAKVKRGLSVRSSASAATQRTASLKGKGEEDIKAPQPTTFSALLKQDGKEEDEGKLQVNGEDRRVNIEIDHEDHEGEGHDSIRLNISL